MKRELKPFVVEVKRGKRRSPFGGQVESQNAQTSEASRRADVGLFAVSPTQQIEAKSQRSETIGRILPSLIETAPSPDPIREHAPRRRGRKPGSKNKPKVLNGGEVSASGASATSPKRGSPTRSGNFAFSAGFPIPISAAPGAETETLAGEPPGSILSERAAPPAQRVRLRERSAILARYVFGTEPAPGERWKRPSRRSAARTSKYKISI